MQQPLKLAFANQKGGVGKTATVLGIASALSNRGERVLVVDADPQGNATTGLAVEITDDMLTTADLMAETVPGSAADAVVATIWDGVDLIPADHRLSAIESSGDNDIIFRLDVAFEGLDLSPYSLVLFDCPPSLGKVLYTVLCAADRVIAVAEPTTDSVAGVGRLEATVQSIVRRPNPRLKFDKIVISKRRGTGEHQWRENELRQAYGEMVAQAVIPELTVRQDAHSAQTPIHLHRGGKAIALRVAYDDLLEELRREPA